MIVAAWLAYLLPMWVRRDSAKHADVFDPASRFSEDVRIVRDSDRADEERAARVSTPLTRRAAVESMRRAERHAAVRRRNVILVLLAAVVVMVVLSVLGITTWWTVAIPGGLLVAFLALARITVRAMHRAFDRRLAALDDEGAEATQLVAEAAVAEASQRTGVVDSVELGIPAGKPGTLWDPLPVTRPNYLSAPPVSGRTVRTIDLTAPEPVHGDNKPIVADLPEESWPESTTAPRLRAVGE